MNEELYLLYIFVEGKEEPSYRGHVRYTAIQRAMETMSEIGLMYVASGMFGKHYKAPCVTIRITEDYESIIDKYKQKLQS